MIGGLVARHSIIRRRPVMVADGRGGREADWSQPDSQLEIEGWAVDAGNTVEDNQNRDATLLQWTLRGPFDADVQEHDHVMLFGDRFELDGEPRRQPGPSNLTSHTILLLKRWKG